MRPRFVITRAQSGEYSIQIVTRDHHHFGTYGYIYHDRPESPRPDAHYPDLLATGHGGPLVFYGKKIPGQDGHWWTGYNNLN